MSKTLNRKPSSPEEVNEMLEPDATTPLSMASADSDLGGADVSDRIQHLIEGAIASLNKQSTRSTAEKLQAQKEKLLLVAKDQLNQLKEQMETSIADAEEQLERRLDAIQAQSANHGEANSPGVDELELKRNRVFAERIFLKRQSALTELLHQKEFQTIYHIFVSVMLLWGINLGVMEVLEHGYLMDTSMVAWNFHKTDIVIPAWAGMFAFSLLVVPLVQAIYRFRLRPRTWLPVYAVMQLTMYCIPSFICIANSLPPASGFIIMCEMARLSMKMHAYVREKMVHATNNKYSKFIPKFAKDIGVEERHLHRPKISVEDTQTELGRYLYFQFAPTLVYRDVYPRSGNRVKWLTAGYHAFNFLGTVVYTYLVFRTLVVPQFRETAKNPGDHVIFIKSVFRSMLPGMLTLLLLFFGVLHSWFNLFAELLRFGDRRFYSDWWNARTWSDFYRKWNSVVHEWLYYYVYLDAMRLSLGRISRGTAWALVFVFSAIIHEQILSCGLGFFYPVLLIMFGGPGVFFTFLAKRGPRAMNMLMWCMLMIGTALLLVLYAREWFARSAYSDLSALHESGHMLVDLIPRSWLPYLQLDL